MAESEFVPITDPDDPRLQNTPLNPPDQGSQETAPPDGNFFDNLTPDDNQRLGIVRNDQFEELRKNPQLLGDLFSLTHNEVGTQGREAQQAFMESVFNRAAARGQTLDEAIHDASYYPRISLSGADLKGSTIDEYGKILRDVGLGSNISNGATGNASQNVGFNGGPQTFAAGGERFGIEGPDIDKTPAPFSGVVLTGSEGKGQPRVTDINDFFGDLSSPSPEPLPAPNPSATPDLMSTAVPRPAGAGFLARLIDKAAASTGLVEPNTLQNLMGPEPPSEPGMIPVIPQQQGRVAQIAAGVGNIPIGIANFATSPEGVATAYSLGISPTALQRLAGAGFAIQQAVQGIRDPTLQGKITGLGGAALGAHAAMALPAKPLQSATGVRGSGKFRKTANIDKTLGDMMEGIGASRESGALMGELATRNLTNGLSKSQVTDLGNYLVTERLERQRQVRTNDLQNNPDPSLIDYLGTAHDQPHPQILPPSEMQRIASDPKIRKAIDYYRSDIEPRMENIHARAGTNPKAIDQLRGAYIPLIKSDVEIPKQYGKSLGRVSTKTRFAKRATGAAAEYNTNVGDLIKEGFSEALRKARINDFFKEAKSKGLADHVVRYGPKGEVFSVFDPENSFDLKTPEGQTLYKQLRSATRQTEDEASGPVVKGVRAAQRATTTLALTANPAEIQNHMRRQFNVVSNVPPVGQGLAHRLAVLIPYLGPKTSLFARTVFRNADSPQFQETLQRIFDAGGGSARSLSNFYELKNPVAKYSGLKSLQHKTHTLLFGIPKGKGFNGWDLRMRVALEDIRAAAEGNKDPQRVREFANQIGQYGSNQDWLITAAKQINPYAGTSLPMRWTEMKQAIGLSGLKEGLIKRRFRQAETMLRGTGGTIIALASANYMLSGHWPWENAAGHEFDLETPWQDENGKPIYIKLRIIAPELSRPVKTIGLDLLSRESTAEHPDYVGALEAAAGNAGLSLVTGPLQNALLTATTGKVPYLVRAPGGDTHFMDVSQVESGKSKGIENLIQAAKSLNPLAEAIPSNAKRREVELPGALKFLERPVFGFHGIKPFGDVFTTSYEKKEPKHKQSDAQRAAVARRKRKREAQSGD